MASSWTDRWPSRVCDHLEMFRAQEEIWMGGRLWNLHCSSVSRRKLTRYHKHQPRRSPLCRKGTCALEASEGRAGDASQSRDILVLICGRASSAVGRRE